MYPITSTVKALFEAEQYQTLRITGTDRRGNSILITDANVVMNGFNIDRYSCNGDKLELGTAIAAELTLKLDNRGGQFSGIAFEGTELNVEIGIADWSQANPEIEYIPCGYFTCYDQPRTLSTITIHALDRMALLDKLPPSPMPWTDGNGNQMTTGDGEDIYFMVGVVFPATIKGIVEQVCERCNLTLGTDLTTLPNYNYTVSAMPELQQQVTYRNIIQWCAGIMGCNAWIDWTGKLRFTWYVTGAITSYETTEANRFSSDLFERDITITGVSYTNTQGSTVIAGIADYTVDMTGNYLAADGLAQILPAINNRINDFEYRPFSASVINAPYLWPMDKITFMRDDDEYICAVTNVNFGINGNTMLEGKGMTAQTNGNTAPMGATNEQAFLIEKAVESSVNIVDRSLDQEAIFNKLTNNGQVQGLLLYNGRVYINADYIQSGTINADLIKVGTLNGNDVSIINLNANNITSGQIGAQYINAANLHVNAANIDGTLVIGQLPSDVAVDSDIPTAVSELTNDSGYQNSTQVTTIAGNVITTAQLNADNITSGTLNAGRIAANSIAVEKLTGTISATSTGGTTPWSINLANGTLTLGDINADNIKAGTISDATGVTTWNLANGILQNTYHYSVSGAAEYHTRARMTGGQIIFFAQNDDAGATSYTQQGGVGATGSGVSLFDKRAQGYVRIETGSDAGSFDSSATNTNGRIIVNTNSSTQSTIWLHSTRLRVGTSDDLQAYYGYTGSNDTPATFTTADGKTVSVYHGIITDIS